MKQSENLQASVTTKAIEVISANSKNSNKQTFSSVNDKLFSLLPKQQKQLKTGCTKMIIDHTKPLIGRINRRVEGNYNSNLERATK